MNKSVYLPASHAVHPSFPGLGGKDARLALEMAVLFTRPDISQSPMARMHGPISIARRVIVVLDNLS